MLEFIAVVLITIFLGFVIGSVLFLCVFLYHYPHRQSIRCKHPKLSERKWVEDDGTCMVYYSCPDCGFHDQGHVYADSTTWAN